MFCLIGAFSLNNSVFDIIIMIIFGVVGYIMRKLEYEPAPFVLAFLLSPMIEESLRQALLYSDGNFSIFFIRPISAVFICLSIFLLATSFIPGIRKKRDLLGGHSAKEI
jgi:TctA family transporter